MYVRETWNNAPPRLLADQWNDINAFLARLTNARVLDFSLYGLCTLRNVMEEPREDDSSTTPDAPLEAWLPVAVSWMEHCGKTLLGQSKEKYSFEGAGGGPGPLCQNLGVEVVGFSTERWAFWIKRFEEISTSKSDSPQTAKRGLQMMRLADQG